MLDLDGLSGAGALQFGPTPATRIVGNPWNDSLMGGDGKDVISGLAGDDTLAGAGGDDRLVGGKGNDTLIGGEGDDLIEGGAGNDGASYFDATVGVRVDLSMTGAQDTGWGVDTISGVENLFGSAFADQLTGDAAANIIASNGGGDTIDGGGGDDLLGSVDGDTTADGGSGVDTLQIFNGNFGDTRGVDVDLTLQGKVQDTGRGMMLLSGIENVTSTLIATNDSLTGDGAGNILAGGGGLDLLSGGAGDDRLLGDGFISVSADTGLVTVWDVFITGGDDTLVGGAGNDTLVGGFGSNLLTGGGGKDVFVLTAASAIDTITDLTRKDFIDLTHLDAGDPFMQVKHFDGGHHEMMLTYDPETDVTRLLIDFDGDREADYEAHIDGKATSFDNFIF